MRGFALALVIGALMVTAVRWGSWVAGGSDSYCYVHQAERGFHNYAMPYSWDVRLGHKQRQAAVTELDDALDPVAIRDMLDRVSRDTWARWPNTRVITGAMMC